MRNDGLLNPSADETQTQGRMAALGQPEVPGALKVAG